MRRLAQQLVTSLGRRSAGGASSYGAPSCSSSPSLVSDAWAWHACSVQATSPCTAAPSTLPQGVSGPWLTFAAQYAKGKGGKAAGGKGKQPKGEAADNGGPDADFDLAALEQRMSAVVQHLAQEMTKIRSGRANPGLLEPIMVEVNGRTSPLRTLGTVTQRNPHLLVVTMFNTKDLSAAAKAIQEPPLQLQARVEGQELQVPVPRPTVEVLERMAKLVRQEAEKAATQVRQIRQLGLKQVDKALKQLPDEKHRADKQVQQLCDRFVGEISQLKLQKEKDFKDNH